MKYEKSKSQKKRILILGDSQLEKWPLEHCLAKDIESFCLQNDIGCINAAHHGFGPIEYLDRALTIAPEYKPDLILIFYYAGNDLTDVLYRSDINPKKPTYDIFSAESKEGEESRKKEMERLEKSKSFITVSEEEKQKMLRENNNFDWEGFENYGIDTTIIQYAKNRMLFPNVIGKEYVNPWLLVNAVYMPDYLVENTMVDNDNSRYAWFRVIKYLEKILQYARSADSKICIISIPNNVQVDSSHFDFYRKLRFNVTSELLKSNRPQQLLDTFSLHYGITHVNLLSAFRDMGMMNDMFFENDDHLSEKGHITAFSAVKDLILEPYKNDALESSVNNNPEKYYLKYTEWAVPHVVKTIKDSPDWYKQVVQKATDEKILLDSALVQNARYAIQNEN